MKKMLKNIQIGDHEPIAGLADLSRRVAAEGIVLLKNDNVLPIINKKVSVFGRIQANYYKSGTGSGGLVNVNHVTNIIEGLLQNPKIEVNMDLLASYNAWIADNPYNAGNGQWGSEPWSQVEMPLTDEIVKKADSESDTAIIIIGRTAGEDHDNYAGEGSFCLSKGEDEMIKMVTKYFKKVAVILNVGNVIDMTFMDKYPVGAVMYAWHGGMEGGRAVSDVLSGNVNPSGKLADTIAFKLEDYPSTANFGNPKKNVYQEDIYVGYRYFETFAKDRVRYPFGFGLSYTTFAIDVKKTTVEGDLIVLDVAVKNTGKQSGKEVVQVYYEAPQGVLGKPLRQLAAVAKTNIIEPQKQADLTIKIDINKMASYDDGGATGHRSAYVLEAGQYIIYVGNSVRDAIPSFKYELPALKVVEQLVEACAPVESFKRFKPIYKNGKYEIGYEDAPTRKNDLNKRQLDNAPVEHKVDFKEKYTLKDVYDKKVTMEEFVAQFTNYELSCLFRGEGMSSPKVTPGTAAAIGGVTRELAGYGLPIACASDGPSGIRMDSGQQATSLPNGTNMACTMNYELVKELYYIEGKELLAYNIDTLLGPGMNIHRNPLNGRNFEYQSEDPLITGLMGQAVTVGLQMAGVTGTLKHMACNNQELARFDVDSVLSERAIREIYLKGYEIAVKAGKSRIIMTSYNPINGIWAASNYEMNSAICHDEWGFKGTIMTDWWAKMNEDGGEGSKQNTRAMVRSQNDLYMVIPDSASNSNKDNSFESLEDGTLSRGEAQRSAINICEYLIQTAAFKRNNNIEITDNLYKEDSWFMVEQQVVEYPTLDGILVNGKKISDFNPCANVYFIDGNEDDLFRIEPIANNDLKVVMTPARPGCNSTIIHVSNGSEENVYFVIVEDVQKRKQANSLLNIDEIKPSFVNVMTAGNWDAAVLKLEEPSYKTKEIVIDTADGVVLKNCLKGEIISYAVDVMAYGKYIIELELSSNESDLAQIPVSILVDEVNKSTLTMSGTGGNWLKVNSHIVIEKGFHYLSLRFGRTGINVKGIKMIKHS